MGGVAKCFTLYWWYWCKFMVPVTVNKWVLWCYQKSWKKFHQSHLWVTGKRSPSHYHYARLEKNIHQHKTQISVVLWPRLGRLQAGRRKTVQEPFTETESEATMGNGWVTDGEYYSRQTGWPSAAGAGAAFCL